MVEVHGETGVYGSLSLLSTSAAQQGTVPEVYLHNEALQQWLPTRWHSSDVILQPELLHVH